MPGVPKSRGCNACLKQKKKCDQAKPACSRCARLGIPCVGSGEQKYVFKPVSFTKPFNTSFPKTRKRDKSSQVSITHKPQNSLTLLQAKLVAALEITDFRYGLNCYGDFLEHIPRRLGHSHALDVSIDLMMSILPYHYTHEIPAQFLAKYGSCLKVLRSSQEKKGTQLSFEDIAAFHIMAICQSWLGQADNDLKSRGRILARFIDAATERSLIDTFELNILGITFVSLFLEALIDPSIDPAHYATSITSQSRQTTCIQDQNPQIRILQLQRLISIPIFMHEPLRYVDEIKMTYQELRDNHARLQHHHDKVRKQAAPSERSHGQQKLIYRLQVAEAILLTAALALNKVLRSTYPDNSVLLLEASTLTNELITLAKAVSQYRPLGASYIPPCLAAVWATTSALKTEQDEIETLLAEYQHDYARIKWMDQAVLLGALNGILLERLFKPSNQDKVEKSEIDGNLNLLMVHFKAALGSIGGCFFPSS
ncbi:hypothetical protein F52700_9339 [Fusarium sp. NRRL 52700]|nr:hypothetical protein F52700_9339 [Fusarium sp. NRRL 52700]